MYTTPSRMSTSSMQQSSAGAACMPLCLWDWHVAVGVGWLRHCHSLDVMRKSTLDLPLWSALLEDPRGQSVCPVWVSRGRPIPGRLQARVAVILTDWCNKILTSLSETVTSQACVGRGGEREERVGVGKWGQARVGDTKVCLYVSVSFFFFFFLGAGVYWWEKSGISTIHCGTMLTPSPTRLRPNCRAPRLT